jgi:phosphate starvation-inducible PhoH-like protein
MKFTLDIQSSDQLANICGSLDKNLDNIAKNLKVKLSNKGSEFNIKGDNAPLAISVLQELLSLSESKTIDSGDINLCIKSQKSGHGSTKSVTIKTSRKHINIRSANQQNYVNAIIENDAVFAIGPAGTGKTYLAVARAVEALENSNVKRIILVRPAVEAGEKLGFLPGDLSERVNRLIEKHVIEVAPLAFMRGRTLNECYIILDEAQNTTIPQMKMFLTRMGFGSKMVITGDITQIDLPNPSQSGLLDAMKILDNIEQITFCELDSQDIVRHQLVKQIVSAYDQAK